MQQIRLGKWVFASTLVLFLTACGGGDDDGPGSASSATATAPLSSGATTAAATISRRRRNRCLAFGHQVAGFQWCSVGWRGRRAHITSADNSRFRPAPASTLPSNRSVLAFIDLAVTDGSKAVKTFSQPATVGLNLTGTGASPGDSVALYSFDGTNWSTSPEGTVIVDGNLQVNFNMGRLLFGPPFGRLRRCCGPVPFSPICPI